jgi:hypothetical protein
MFIVYYMYLSFKNHLNLIFPDLTYMKRITNNYVEFCEYTDCFGY